jgi:hypothetical protein
MKMHCQSKGIRYSLGSSLLMTSIVLKAMGSSSMLGAHDTTGIYLNRLGLLSPNKVSACVKQLETLGMVHVPTCLVGPGLVQHSLVPDLLGPVLAHHGLELGLAFLRASLDHLRLDHLGLVLGINWRLQLGIRRVLYQRVLPHHQGFQCLGGLCHPLPCHCCCLDQIQNAFCKILHGS